MHIDIMPEEDLKWQFEKIHEQEDPGCRTNKIIFWHPHGQEV